MEWGLVDKGLIYPSRVHTTHTLRLLPESDSIRIDGTVKEKSENVSRYLEGNGFEFWTCRDKIEVH